MTQRVINPSAPAIWLVVLFCLLACQREKAEPQSAIDVLAGRWYWTSTCGGLSGMCQEANATTPVAAIEFQKDYTFIRLENGQVQRRTTFELAPGVSIYDQQRKELLRYADGTVQSFLVQGDSLTLRDEVFDGKIYNYARRRAL